MSALTLHGEDHALADVRADAVGRLAEVEAAVFLQHVSDEQRAVVHDLDAACQRHGVVLLGVPDASWTDRKQWKGRDDDDDDWHDWWETFEKFREEVTAGRLKYPECLWHVST